MSQTIAILGRQPALGIAELESLYGSDALKRIGQQAVLVDKDPSEIDINRLGGSIKLAKALTSLDFNDWNKLTTYLVEHVPKHTCCIGPGKLIFGISTYGMRINPKMIERTALSVKKAVRTSDGRPVRVVPTKGTELSSAQVLHNKMYVGPLGMELVFIADGNGVWLAQTFGIQDIEAYTARDQTRPKRDAQVGMLPPKLAQIIVNLARPTKSVLDPFCGTGVILQEAVLMGLQAYGSDLEPRMVEYSLENVDKWLRAQHPDLNATVTIETGDATTHRWKSLDFDAIATESYLGRPFAGVPDQETLRQVMSDVNTITKKFLQNVVAQTGPGFRMCVAVPAWKTGSQFKHLPTLDHLEELGYTRLSLKHVDNKDLIYHREGQIVGRELVILARK